VWGFEPVGRANRVSSVYCEHNRIGVDMRAHTRSSVVACLCVAGTLAATGLVSPPQPQPPPTVAHRVQLAAAPALGAIPLAFIRNQFQYCSLICPHAVDGAITVSIGGVQAPVTFLNSLASTGSLFKAFGAAAASVTGPANAATTPLINNDVFLVVPKAFHALDVAVVEAFNVGGAVLTPGQFVDAIQNGRTRILGALDQPVGPPTTLTGATNILQVVSVEVINVTTAVAFQAGELLLAGVVQTADATAQELARSGDPGAALAAGADRATQTLATAGGIVADAVDTALINIRDSLADPFPSTATVAATEADPPADLDAGPATNRTSRPATPKITADEQPDTVLSIATKNGADESPNAKKPADSANPDHSGASSSVSSGSSTVAGRSAGSNDNATPSAKKNRMNSGPPR
jgi:hypothetical protein